MKLQEKKDKFRKELDEFLKKQSNETYGGDSLTADDWMHLFFILKMALDSGCVWEDIKNIVVEEAL